MGYVIEPIELTPHTELFDRIFRTVNYIFKRNIWVGQVNGKTTFRFVIYIIVNLFHARHSLFYYDARSSFEFHIEKYLNTKVPENKIKILLFCWKLY